MSNYDLLQNVEKDVKKDRLTYINSPSIVQNKPISGAINKS